MPQSMGLQKVIHDLATEQEQQQTINANRHRGWGKKVIKKGPLSLSKYKVRVSVE